jgi:hypothetical protein
VPCPYLGMLNVNRSRGGGWGYFFHVPSWAKKEGCTVHSERLGTDYKAAVLRAEAVLLPAFDAWRTGGKALAASPPNAFGTLDWMFAEYRSDRRYAKLDPKSKRNHEVGFKLVGGYVLKMASDWARNASARSIRH